MSESIPKKRGFAGLKERNPEALRAIASKGGKAGHALGRAHEFTSEEARAAGSKGGKATRLRARQQRLFPGDDS